MEEYVKRESDERLDEVELREAEEYLNSPAAKILGASQKARQLVRRSRNKLDETKKRQAEELEEAQKRAREQEQLRRAETEKVTLLRRQRNFGVILVVLGVIVLIALAALGYLINEKRKSWEQTAAELEKQRQIQVEKGQSLRENAKAVLDKQTRDPIKDITALRNLVAALNLNREDGEAAAMAAKLLLERVWCPPAASEVRYREDALLAATFAPGMRSSLRQVTVSCCFGRATNCRSRGLGRCLRNRNHPINGSCNLGSRPSVRMGNGLSLFHHR